MLLNPSLGNIVPKITANQSTTQANEAKTNKVDQSSFVKINQTNLEWQTFDGSLPDRAVSIYNGYVGRTDYVAKYGYSAGFYNPGKGPYCFYPWRGQELRGSPFEILVNKDNFEFLEWKDGSNGSVPQNAVETSPGSGIYVGKNEYGLGEVDVKSEVFFLPWEGYEYWYNYYQVLTFNKDVISEDISDVKYNTDGVKVIDYPPQTIHTTVITNNENQPVKQITNLSKTIQTEQRWDTSSSLTMGIKTSITAGIPEILQSSIEINAETTLQLTNGTTYTESTTQSVSVEVNVPPKHSCRVRMVGYNYGADIPYTARLKRTYRNGKTTWTSISGTYKSVQMGEVRGVVDPCEPVTDPKPLKK